MKILYVPSLNIGVCYWRIENYANELVRQKVPVYVEYFFDPRLGLAWDKLCVDHGKTSHTIQEKLEKAFQYFDVIIFQKIQAKPGAVLVQNLKEQYPNVTIIAEIDDSLGDITPSNIREMKDEGMWSAEHVHFSDGVICSTQHLADSVAELNPNRFVAPNCIDPGSWAPILPTAKAERKRLVYVGGGGHDEDLEIIKDPMIRVLSENPDVDFVVRYGGFALDWMKGHSQIDFKSVAWCLDEYPQKLANLNAHVALAPLRDSNFNRSKSALKWVEWGSLGVGIVASDVGPYKGLPYAILSGNSDEQWYAALKKAISTEPSPQLPYVVNERFNLAENTKALVEWLQVFCDNAPNEKRENEVDSFVFI